MAISNNLFFACVFTFPGQLSSHFPSLFLTEIRRLLPGILGFIVRGPIFKFLETLPSVTYRAVTPRAVPSNKELSCRRVHSSQVISSSQAAFFPSPRKPGAKSCWFFFLNIPHGCLPPPPPKGMVLTPLHSPALDICSRRNPPVTHPAALHAASRVLVLTPQMKTSPHNFFA